MPSRINDPAYWRHRAEEMRDLAKLAEDINARASMLAIADEYNKLAKRAEQCSSEPRA
jgi:hypothetical protein